MDQYGLIGLAFAARLRAQVIGRGQRQARAVPECRVFARVIVGIANQAILIHGPDKRSLLETCRLSAAQFLLSDNDARALIRAQIVGIMAKWNSICDEAKLAAIDSDFLLLRQFLNDYAFEGYIDGASGF